MICCSACHQYHKKRISLTYIKRQTNPMRAIRGSITQLPYYHKVAHTPKRSTIESSTTQTPPPPHSSSSSISPTQSIQTNQSLQPPLQPNQSFYGIQLSASRSHSLSPVFFRVKDIPNSKVTPFHPVLIKLRMF